MRDAVKCNAATNYVRVAAHPFLPEILGHHRDIRAFFFLRQEIAAANRTHAKDIEIVRGDFAAKKLNGIPQPGQSERNCVFAAETVEDRLAIPIMLKARHRHRELQQLALPGIRVHVHDTSRFLKRQSAQKKIIDQTEDRGVQPNPERERE